MGFHWKSGLAPFAEPREYLSTLEEMANHDRRVPPALVVGAELDTTYVERFAVACRSDQVTMSHPPRTRSHRLREPPVGSPKRCDAWSLL